MDTSISRGTHILQQSCKKNKELMDLIALMESNLNSSDSKMIGTLSQKLKLLQKEVIELDLSFDLYREKVGALTSAEGVLFTEKRLLQRDIRRGISALTPRVKTVKAALAGEMQTLKRGRNAMHGYGGNSNYGGRLINKSM